MDLSEGRISGEIAEAVATRGARFVDKYRVLHSTHADDYFLKDPLGGVASDLVDAIDGLSFKQCMQLPESSSRDFPVALQDFLSEVRASSLPVKQPAARRPSRLRKNFTPKKQHEVDQLSALISSLASTSCTEWVVNIGEGKGHLSEVIAEMASVDGVIGIDCGIHRDDGRTAALEMYSVKCRVTQDMVAEDYVSVINQSVKKDLVRPCLEGSALVGLHACGDLGSCVVRTFASSSASFLALAPCCHHALTTVGFPLSAHLQALGTPLDSTASRQVACIASARWSAEGDDQLPKYRMHYYRSVAASLLPERLSLPPSFLRKLSKQTDLSLATFVRTVCTFLGKSDADTRQMLLEAEKHDTEASFKRFLTFMTLRRSTAPSLETMYLLDRYLYLLEKGCRCFLLPLFDPVLSPRSYVLVATHEHPQGS